MLSTRLSTLPRRPRTPLARPTRAVGGGSGDRRALPHLVSRNVSDDGSITFVFGEEAPPAVADAVAASPPVSHRAAAALAADRAAATPVTADAPITAPGIEAAAVAEEAPLGGDVPARLHSLPALQAMKVAELRELAAAAAVKGASKLRKADLIDALLAVGE